IGVLLANLDKAGRPLEALLIGRPFGRITANAIPVQQAAELALKRDQHRHLGLGKTLHLTAARKLEFVYAGRKRSQQLRLGKVPRDIAALAGSGADPLVGVTASVALDFKRECDRFTSAYELHAQVTTGAKRRPRTF